MKTRYWVVISVATLLVGLLIGYGIWGSKAREVADLKAKVEQLTQENQRLKAGGTAVSTEATTPAGGKAAPGTPPASLGWWPGK